MQLAFWIIDAVVIAGLAYLSFAMALAGWFASLRRGEAVTLVPMRGGRGAVLAAQLAMVVVGLFLSAALIYWLWIPLPIALPPALDAVLAGLGLVLFVGGTAFVLWARQTLGRMWGISTSREVKLLPDHQLITAGPYGLIRHPMYFGWWLALVGVLLIYHTWTVALMLAISLLAFSQRARLEEKVLAERFGLEWQAYVARTRSLIPFIY